MRETVSATNESSPQKILGRGGGRRTQLVRTYEHVGYEQTVHEITCYSSDCSILRKCGELIGTEFFCQNKTYIAPLGSNSLGSLKMLCVPGGRGVQALF